MQRLGKNLNGYRGDTLDLHAVINDTWEQARNHGWTVHSFAQNDEAQLFALTKVSSAPLSARRYRVYLSAGIHGDEPAGPLAIERLLTQNQWLPEFDLTVVPCLNPNGFKANRRENLQGIDLNRDYLHSQSAEIRAHIAWLEPQASFDLCLCLHEDWESHGFYVYELNPDGNPSLAEAMVAAVSRVCPIDQSSEIEGRPAAGGIIRPNIDPRSRPQWPEAFWLLQHKTRLSYTLEAPSDFPMEVRVQALVTGVNSALASTLLHSEA